MSGFDSLLGQKELKARLGKALEELPGHAFVFIGPDGIGKNSFAREFAKALLCENPNGNGGCGICPSCHYFLQGSHPDYKELLLKDKEKTIKTDVIRKLVCGDITMLPQISKRKVYFIDADDINEQGQNTLLKTLEEPPEYAVLILAISASQNLLPTILSRVIHVPFQRNTTGEIEQILVTRDIAGKDRDKDKDKGKDRVYDKDSGSKGDSATKGNDKKPFLFLAKFSDGIPGVAIHFYESELFSQQREEIIDKMARLPSVSRSDVLLDYFSFFDANKAQVDDILGIMSTWVRDMLIFSTCKEQAELINEDKRTEIRRSCPKGPDTVESLANASRIIHSARRGIALNSSFENCICTMLLQLRKELKNA